MPSTLAEPRHRSDSSPGETRRAERATSGRNRAVDALRVAAMVMVALGHWMAADAHLAPDGSITGGNGLSRWTVLHPLTWIFQVMPLFFCVGGFANAASLQSARRNGISNSVWISSRLRRLVAPVAPFAAIWLALTGAGKALGHGQLVTDAAQLAAIPIWFLATYTADIALSPLLRRMWHRHRWSGFAVLVGTVVGLDLLRLLTDVSMVQLPNVIAGWSCFQLLGIAWHDGALDSARLCRVLGWGSFIAAVSLVAFGPWPLSLVSVPGAKVQNTWPPSAVLIAYGIAQCMAIVSIAPRLERRIEARPNLWKFVQLGGSVNMSVYLWHLSAFAVSAGLLAAVGHLGSETQSTAAAMVAKIPLIGVALIVLGLIVAAAARSERRALLDRRSVCVPVWQLALIVPALIAAFDFLTLQGAATAAGATASVTILVVHAVLQRSSRCPQD